MTEIHARPLTKSEQHLQHDDEDGCSSSKKVATFEIDKKKEKMIKEKRKVLKRL